MMQLNQRKSHHVFVTGLSTFPGHGKMEKTTYQFLEPSFEKDDPNITKKARYSFDGYYQLDPVPMFLTEGLKFTITDVILLATKEVKKSKSIEPAFDDSPGPEIISPLDYYSKRLRTKLCHNPEVNIVVIDVDEMALEKALEDVMNKLRELYNDTDMDSQDSWKLWFDTHGGFRDISMVMVSAARFFATDKHYPIRTDGIYSVYHSQDKGSPDRIVDQTGFYFADSAESLRNFLNYGQYLAMQFQPYEGDKPYAFVSYRHDKKFITDVRIIFSWFNTSEIAYWFDDGIPYRSNWRKTIETKNNEASAFIALLSNSYFESAECWKELIRAIYNGKSAQKRNYMHLFLLEDNTTLPEKIPAEFEEVRRTAEELGVNDQDIHDWLGYADNIQWLQWFQYTGGNKAINNRNFNNDPRLQAVADAIRANLTVK